MAKGQSAEKTVRDIQRKTRRRFSAEEKIHIVLEGLRGEESVAELCRREGINAIPGHCRANCQQDPVRLSLTKPRSLEDDS